MSSQKHAFVIELKTVLLFPPPQHSEPFTIHIWACAIHDDFLQMFARARDFNKISSKSMARCLALFTNFFWEKMS